MQNDEKANKKSEIRKSQLMIFTVRRQNAQKRRYEYVQSAD